MAKQTYDLITAKVEAAALSRKEKKTVFILLITTGENEGDCALSFQAKVPNHEAIHAYRNGSEVPLDSNITEPVTKADKKMATSKSKKAIKKTASKSATTAKEKTTTRGNNMSLTPENWKKVDALLKKKDISFSAFSRGLVLDAIK